MSNKYVLDTGLISTPVFDIKFASDRSAWNYLAKKLDARYKTGHEVVAVLYRIDEARAPFLHTMHLHTMHVPAHPWARKRFWGYIPKEIQEVRVPVRVGFACYDYDGNPWNNDNDNGNDNDKRLVSK